LKKKIFLILFRKELASSQSWHKVCHFNRFQEIGSKNKFDWWSIINKFIEKKLRKNFYFFIIILYIGYACTLSKITISFPSFPYTLSWNSLELLTGGFFIPGVAYISKITYYSSHKYNHWYNYGRLHKCCKPPRFGLFLSFLAYFRYNICASALHHVTANCKYLQRRSFPYWRNSKTSNVHFLLMHFYFELYSPIMWNKSRHHIPH